MNKANVLYIMCDQFRFDCISALGNDTISTPNFDRLVRRGASFTNAYSPCPVCVPARYVIRTGKEPFNVGSYCNEDPLPINAPPGSVDSYTGDYLAKTMSNLGYRTFGIGKFHTSPDVYEPLGFDVHIHTEEIWNDTDARGKDGYESFISKEHPEYSYIEQIHGERTNMYYVPQLSGMPKEITVEAFVADKVCEQLQVLGDKPYFGFVSFIGPHPPCAPPIPYNRMYDPDGMQNPIKGDPASDEVDEQIRWMNYLIYADDINDAWARNLKTRYYGEISYIDECLGRILDAVEARDDADNTLICFFSDHGDMLGDHGGWQKESYYEQSTKIPFLLSYPRKIDKDTLDDRLVSLTDLFAIATAAAGETELRDGVDVLNGGKRDVVFGVYGRPGTARFKIMARAGDYKYIYFANGGKEQLFNLKKDPNELKNVVKTEADVAGRMRKIAIDKCLCESGLAGAATESGMVAFDYEQRTLLRLHQFDFSKNVTDYTIPSGCSFVSDALSFDTEE